MRQLSYVIIVVVVAGVALVTYLTPEAIDLRADRDEAIETAARRLLAGQDPWSAATHLSSDHLPTVQLGGIALSVPFVAILGDVKWMQPIIFAIALAIIAATFDSVVSGAFAVSMVSSPIIINEIVFQSDIWIFSVLILLTFLVLGIACTARSERLLYWFLAGIFVGLLMSIRFTFVVAFLPLLIWIFRNLSIPMARSVFVATSLSTAALLNLTPLAFSDFYRSALQIGLDKTSVESFSVIGFSALIFLVSILVLLSFRSRRLSGVIGLSAFGFAIPILWQFGIECATDRCGSVSSYVYVFYNSTFLTMALMAIILTFRPPSMRITSLLTR